MSPLDSYIIALGRTGQKAALEPILKRAAELTPQSEFSHFRAVSIALETLRDSRSANVLAELLQKPGTSGHATTTIQKALSNNPASSTDVTTRNQQLTELYLARALFRCGDQNGLGEKILNEYAQDLHGHYARHAQAVLSQKTAKPQIIP
jgi:hypothetical protein